jgi:hypothetical protein
MSRERITTMRLRQQMPPGIPRRSVHSSQREFWRRSSDTRKRLDERKLWPNWADLPSNGGWICAGYPFGDSRNRTHPPSFERLLKPRLVALQLRPRRHRMVDETPPLAPSQTYVSDPRHQHVLSCQDNYFSAQLVREYSSKGSAESYGINGISLAYSCSGALEGFGVKDVG